MSEGLSIPELLGFAPVPFDREKAYSEDAYRALYALTDEEAHEIRERHGGRQALHAPIDLELSTRYMSDLAYRRRITEMRKDITAKEPSIEVRRTMRRLIQTMKPPSEEARRAVEEVIGELPEDETPGESA